MVMYWCRTCGAVIGLREPLTDWTIDRSQLCQTCKDKLSSASEDRSGEKPEESSDETNGK